MLSCKYNRLILLVLQIVFQVICCNYYLAFKKQQLMILTYLCFVWFFYSCHRKSLHPWSWLVLIFWNPWCRDNMVLSELQFSSRFLICSFLLYFTLNPVLVDSAETCSLYFRTGDILLSLPTLPPRLCLLSLSGTLYPRPKFKIFFGNSLGSWPYFRCYLVILPSSHPFTQFLPPLSCSRRL